MIINRVLGNIEKHSAKEWLEANLRAQPDLDDFPSVSSMWVINTDSCKPFSREFILDTHKAKSLEALFCQSSLPELPAVDIASAETISNMYTMTRVKSAKIKNPSLNLKAATWAFASWQIESIPLIYLKNIECASDMIIDAASLKKLPALETNTNTFQRDFLWEDSYAPGSQDLEIDTSDIRYPNGKTAKPWCLKWSLSFGKAHINHDTALYLINNLEESRLRVGQTLSLSSYTMSLLSDEEKAIAISKGWKLADNG